MSFRKFSCQICDHLCDEEKGDPDSGLAPGTRLEGATKADFQVMACELS